MAYDKVLEMIGGFGKFQKRAVFLVALVGYPYCVQVLLTTFTMAVPDFRCAVPNLQNDTYEAKDSKHQQLIMNLVPYDNKTEAYSSCDIYDDWSTLDYNNMSSVMYNVDGRSTSKCSNWVYSREIFTSTLVEDLDLVCDRKSLSTTSSTMAMLGVMFGGFVGGIFADKFGRKPTILGFVFLNAVGGMCMVAVTSETLLLALRLFNNFCGLACFIVASTYCMELVGPKKRAFSGSLIMFGWVFGLFVMLGVAYFVRDWKMLQLIITAPTFLIMSYYWLIPESPRWLINKGRIEEASKILCNMAAKNGVTSVDKEQMVSLCAKSDGQSLETKQSLLAGFLEIAKSHTVRLRMVIMCINWMAIPIIYFGFSLNVGSIIEGDLYVNFVIMSALESLAYVVAIVTMDRFGRKFIMCFCLIGAGVACLGTMIPTLLDKQIPLVNVVLSNIGKFGATICFATVYIYTAELLPTSVRNSGLGTCSLIGRIGGVISPVVANTRIPGKFGKILPFLIFGGTAIFAGALSLLLPETVGKTLPNSVEEAEAMSRKRNNVPPKNGKLEHV